jgi:hypothetical protein
MTDASMDKIMHTHTKIYVARYLYFMLDFQQKYEAVHLRCISTMANQRLTRLFWLE